MITSKSKEVE